MRSVGWMRMTCNWERTPSLCISRRWSLRHTRDICRHPTMGIRICWGIREALTPAQVVRAEPIYAMPSLPPVEVVWYYETNGRSEGPVPAETVRSLLASGRVPLTTLVWSEDLTDWTPANQVPLFAAILRTT